MKLEFDSTRITSIFIHIFLPRLAWGQFGLWLSYKVVKCHLKNACKLKEYHWRALQAKSRESRENMRGAASLGKKRQTLSLPPTCTQLVLCEKGKFSLDGSFSKNAPYKQKIIFHLTSIGKMSKKKCFFFLGG